jgi:hypothetical protein
MISCNIHATEIASSQMAMELAHRLATNDTLQRALDRRGGAARAVDEPGRAADGHRLVQAGAGHAVRGRAAAVAVPPYVGHDNNRDWYMVTQKETRLVTDLLYRRWFPEVFYDVHQQGNEGMRLTSRRTSTRSTRTWTR